MRGGNGRVLAVAWCVLVVLGGLAGTASVASAQPDRISGIDRSSAGGNDPLLAEAGLDQSVPTNSTVFLDATGSTDPDGSISRAEYTSRWFWTVRQATPYEIYEVNGIAGNTTNITVGPDSSGTASLENPEAVVDTPSPGLTPMPPSVQFRVKPAHRELVAPSRIASES
jgi:hypothetical protein